MSLWIKTVVFFTNKLQGVLVRLFIPIALKLKGGKPGGWLERRLTVMSHSLARITRNFLLPGGVSLKDVEDSYDQQSGSYINIFDKSGYQKWSVIDDQVVKADTKDTIIAFGRERAETLEQFSFASVLEVGVGEFTTFNAVRHSWHPEVKVFALDLSLNRLVHGKANLGEDGHQIKLAKANAHHLPLPNNSIDLVYTNHCLEWMPQGGAEMAIGQAVRVAKKWVILFEPAWQDAGFIQRLKIRADQYVRNIPRLVESTPGCRLQEVRHLKNHVNPFNRSSCYVIEVTPSEQSNAPGWGCPQCYGDLDISECEMYCPQCELIFFIYQGIPVLDINYAPLVNLR